VQSPVVLAATLVNGNAHIRMVSVNKHELAPVAMLCVRVPANAGGGDADMQSSCTPFPEVIWS